MLDAYQREINYLRVSVTDRCNLRCYYCMPEEGVKLVSRREILRNEEITKLIEAASQVGIEKIRLTGGEPLVRKGLVGLVESIERISGINDIALTTNGVLLPDMAKELKAAGLKRVNISLDTLNPDTYSFITRFGDINQAWMGIKAALEIGFDPVKINCVVIKGVNCHEVAEIAALTLKYPLHVRFIELMPVSGDNKWSSQKHVSVSDIRASIELVLGNLQEAKKPSGNGPANYFTLPGAIGTIGFISPISHSFCHCCNRLRLTSDGMIRQCLYSEKEYDIKTPLRSGAGMDELVDIFARALRDKPEHHNFQKGWYDDKRSMSQIGG